MNLLKLYGRYDINHYDFPDWWFNFIFDYFESYDVDVKRINKALEEYEAEFVEEKVFDQTTFQEITLEAHLKFDSEELMSFFILKYGEGYHG